MTATNTTPQAPIVTLASGTKIPQIAYGTGALTKTAFDQAFLDAISLAIKNGYRNFDGAERYHTDEELGLAIEQSHIPRSEFFISNKVYHEGGIKNRDIEGSLRASLAAMRMDYVDLYLIHNPFFPEGSLTLEEAWRQMEEIKEKGLAREIGISNFAPVDIHKLLKIAKIKPAVNQIELHPYDYAQEQETLELCKAHGIAIESYSPLVPIARHAGKSTLPASLDAIAKKHNTTPAQVLLKWQTAKGHIVITSSRDPARQASQIDLEGFTLDKEDVDTIEREGAGYPYRHFGWGVFAKEYKSVL